MVIVIKIIIKLLLRKTFTKMQTPPRTPSPLRLPSAVKCPGAPVKKGNNSHYVPPGNSIRQCLFSTVVDDGYETPPPTIRTEPPKLVRKKQR